MKKKIALAVIVLLAVAFIAFPYALGAASGMLLNVLTPVIVLLLRTAIIWIPALIIYGIFRLMRGIKRRRRARRAITTDSVVTESDETSEPVN